jgi:hypothetical protein
VKKLTRKEIAAGLESVPIEVVLLGAAGSGDKALSVKDREFARQLALGESKASAYRKSRPSKAKPETQSKRGQELAKRGAVIGQVEAFKRAIEAQKYATPAHLRALVIDRLTATAINDKIAPAQQLRALELLGKVTEVAAFTERREVVQVTDSRLIRDRLIDSLRLALSAADVIDTTATEIGSPGHPPPGHPLELAADTAPPLLSIPDTRFDENYATTQLTSISENVSVTPVTLRISNEINDLGGKSVLTSVTEGGGIEENVQEVNGLDIENPPLDDLVPSGDLK